MLALSVGFFTTSSMRADNRAMIPIKISGNVYGYSYDFRYEGRSIAQCMPYESGNHNVSFSETVKPGRIYTFTAYGAPEFDPLSGWDPAGNCTFNLNINPPPGFSVYTVSGGAPAIPDVKSSLFGGGAPWLDARSYYTFRFYIADDSVENATKAGTLTKLSVSDLIFELSLGTLENGKSAGRLQMRSDGKVSGSPRLDSNLIKPDNFYVMQAPKAKIATTAITGGKRIETAQVRVDVVSTSTTHTSIRYYARDFQGAYCQSASASYELDLLAGGGTGGADRLAITETQGSVSVVRYIDRYRTGDKWVLVEGSGMTQRVEEHDAQIAGVKKIETITIKDGAGTVVVKNRITSVFDFSEWITKQEIGIDGLLAQPLVSEYDYFINNPDTPGIPITDGNWGKVRRIKEPNGRITMYEYYTDALRANQIKTLTSTWHDSAGAHTKVTSYNYTGPSPHTTHRYPLSEETTIDGITVAKTTHEYNYSYFVPVGGVGYLYKRTTKSWSSGNSSLTTVSIIYPDSGTYATADMPHAQILPSGLQYSYMYEQGSYTNGVFTPNSTGSAWRTSAIEGSSVSTAGSRMDKLDGIAVEPLYLVSGRSTLTRSVRDNSGNIVDEKTYVYNGSAFDLAAPISSTQTAWFDSISPSQRTYANGTSERWTWQGALIDTYTSTSGQATAYTYDSLGRVTTQTVRGVGARPDLVTYSTYDAAGRLATQTVSGGGLSAITSFGYDGAGRPVSTTFPDGRTAFASYQILGNGHTAVTETLSCGGMRITETLADGKVHSRTGTLGTAEYYHYDLLSNGCIATEIRYASSNSSRWNSVTKDWVGRTISTERPGFSGAELAENYYYDARGLLEKITSSSGLADRLFEYDSMGQLSRYGFKLDPSGALNPSGALDRVTDQSSRFEKTDGVWWSVLETKTYPVAGNGTAVTMGKTGGRLSGFSGGVVSETWQEDGFGNRATTSVTLDAVSQTITTSVTSPGCATPARSVTVAGLTSSVTSPDGRSVNYAYDDLGRMTSSTDSRTGATAYAYYEHLGNATNQVSTVTDPAGAATNYGYDSGGRINAIRNAQGVCAYYQYDCSGRVERQWGGALTPVSYSYNSYGELIGMSTYRTGSIDTWSQTTWPAGQTADTTTWNYDAATGLLLSKHDAANQGTDYTYTARGQLQTRSWARLKPGSATERVTATWNYSAKTGEVTSVSYNDGTPGVAYNYNRTGLPSSVTDATGSRSFAYHATDPARLLREDLPEYLGSRRISYNYQGTGPGLMPGRLGSYTLGTAASPAQDLSTGYGFDNLGRINKLNTQSYGDGAAQAYTYAYAASTSMLTSLTRDAGNFSQTRTYEAKRDLVGNVTVLGANNQIVAANTYTNDSLGRCTAREQSGAAFADYGQPTHWLHTHNPRGELTQAFHYMGAGAAATNAMPGRAFEYGYDSAGNRTSGNHTGVAGLAEAHTANNLNQITTKENHTQNVAGVAGVGTSVLVNGQATGAVGQYWSGEVLPGNTSGPAWTQAAVTAASGQAGSIKRFGAEWLFSPKAQETFQYDLDGNLTEDGQWLYTYDAENRLIAMETRPAVLALAGMPAAQKTKLLFAYDYLGRRVSKTTYTWDAGMGAWIPQSIRRFVYQGWNLIAEYQYQGASLTLQTTHHWGMDLAGSLTASGGVGALVRTSVHAGTDAGKTYHYGHDANGNVAVVLDSGGALAAAYEYSPFGELLRKDGGRAASNPWRFSGKYADEETGLVYYGYRYYNPRLGRFINRDPIEETGGINLHAFLSNDPVNRIDVLGLAGEVNGELYRNPPCSDPSDPCYKGIEKDDDGGFHVWDGNGNHYYIDPSGNVSQAVRTDTGVNWVPAGVTGSLGGVSGAYGYGLEAGGGFGFMPSSAVAPNSGEFGQAATANQTGARDRYPYGQQMYSSCVIASIRNALYELGVSRNKIPLEADLRKRVAEALGFDESRFSNKESPKGISADNILSAFNLIMQDFGFSVDQAEFKDLAGLKNALSGSANGVVFAAVVEGFSINPNHMMVVRWAGDEGKRSYFINPGNITESGYAYKSDTARSMGVDAAKWIGGFTGSVYTIKRF